MTKKFSMNSLTNFAFTWENPIVHRNLVPLPKKKYLSRRNETSDHFEMQTTTHQDQFTLSFLIKYAIYQLALIFYILNVNQISKGCTLISANLTRSQFLLDSIHIPVHTHSYGSSRKVFTSFQQVFVGLRILHTIQSKININKIMCFVK